MKTKSSECDMGIMKGRELTDKNKLTLFEIIVTSYNFNSTLDNYEMISKDTDIHVNYYGKRMLEGFKLFKRK